PPSRATVKYLPPANVGCHIRATLRRCRSRIRARAPAGLRDGRTNPDSTALAVVRRRVGARDRDPRAGSSQVLRHWELIRPATHTTVPLPDVRRATAPSA